MIFKRNKIQNTNTETSVNEESTPKKSGWTAVLAIVACILLAVLIWSYSFYARDHMAEKQIAVKFVLTGGESHEFISPALTTLTFFGEESVLDRVDIITYEVSRDEFETYGEKVTINIPYSEGYHTHTTQVELALYSTVNKSDDKATDK